MAQCAQQKSQQLSQNVEQCMGMPSGQGGQQGGSPFEGLSNAIDDESLYNMKQICKPGEN